MGKDSALDTRIDALSRRAGTARFAEYGKQASPSRSEGVGIATVL